MQVTLLTVLSWVSWLAGTISFLILLVEAFRESKAQGFLSLFLPFYALYYLLFRQQRRKAATILLTVFALACSFAGTKLYKGPCDSFPKSGIEALLDDTFNNPTHANDGKGRSVCTYQSSAHPSNKLVVLQSACSGSLKDTISEQELSSQDGFTVSGVGDSAISVRNWLLVQKGDKCVAFRYDNGQEDPYSSLQPRKKVAALVLAENKQ